MHTVPSPRLAKRSSAVAQLGRAFSVFVSGRVLAAVAQAGFLALLARAVNVAQFAALSMLLSLAAIAAVVADVGNTPALSRAAAKGNTAEVARLTAATNGQAALAALLWVFGCLAVCLALSVAPWPALLGVWILGERLVEGRSAVLLAVGRNSGVLALLLIRRLVPILVFLGIRTTTEAVASAYLAMAVAGAGAVLVAAVLAPWPMRTSVGRLTGSSIAFYGNSVLAQVRQLDIVVANLLVPGAASGLYAAASRLISPLRLIPSSLGTVVLAHASRSADIVALRARVPLLGAVMAAVYGLLAVFADVVTSILYGERYADAAPVLRILLVGLCFAAMSSSYTSLLQAAGLERVVARTALIATGAGFACAAALAPAFRAEGVAVGMSVLFVLQWWLLSRAAKELS